MLKKITASFVLATVFIFAACGGYDYDWMSGNFAGRSTLSSKPDDYSSIPATVIQTGTGGFSFDAESYFTLGDDTPLPGCHLQANLAEEDGKYRLTELDRAYKGVSQDLQGCLAQVGAASARVDITDGWIRRDPSGETVLHLTFQKRDSPETPLFEYELRARKTSWLW